MNKVVAMLFIFQLALLGTNAHSTTKRIVNKLSTAEHKKVIKSPMTIQATTTNIPPGTSKIFTRKTSGGATTASYEFWDYFPAGITASVTEVGINSIYQVVMKFEISVAASVPYGQQYSGYVEFDLYDYSDELKKTMTYEFTIITAPNQPPTLSNGQVSPMTGVKHSSQTYRFSVIYKDPEGDSPLQGIHFTLNPGTATSHTVSMLEGSGDFQTGKEYYQDYGGGYFRYGLNHFVFAVGNYWFDPVTILPETGEFEGPIVHNVDFDAAPKSGDVPLTVQFTDQTYKIDDYDTWDWNWDFGDGTSSTQQNPVHTYTASGSYNVTLDAVSFGQRDEVTKTNFITVETPTTPAPTAAFSATPTSGGKPLTVQFTDQSTGSITGYSWDFGDGGSSTQQNPSHTYNSEGTFTVSLTVTGSGGSDTKTETDLITVAGDKPNANFSGTPTSGTKPLDVQFTDCSIGVINSYNWEFGDGSSSTDKNPLHTYNTTGAFTVRLTVTGPGGANRDTKREYITVTESALTAAFSATPVTGDKPLSVHFTDESSGAITGFSWDFGDGGTSTIQNPVHTYNSAGTFSVSLTVTGPGGSDTDTKNNYIIINNPTSNIELIDGNTPENYSLLPNYPNPFNPGTNIKFQIPENSKVRIAVFNVEGKLVKELINEQKQPGTYNIYWDAGSLPSGTYIIYMNAGVYQIYRKSLFVK